MIQDEAETPKEIQVPALLHKGIDRMLECKKGMIKFMMKEDEFKKRQEQKIMLATIDMCSNYMADTMEELI